MEETFGMADIAERVVYLTEDELSRLLVVAEGFQRYSLLIRFLARTGARIGEVLPMACSQYKKDEVQVIFDRSLAKVSSFKPGKMQSGKRDFPLRKLGKKYTILEAKGGSYVKKVADLTGPEIFEKYAGADEIVKLGLKAGHARRVIPLLDNNVINALSAACANATPNTLLFPGEDGPLNEKAVNKRLHKMAKMADIAQSKAHAHVLRHTFGVWAAKKGMNIVMIARLMGHGTPEKPRIETTAIYQQFAIEDLRDDMRKRGIGF